MNGFGLKGFDKRKTRVFLLFFLFCPTICCLGFSLVFFFQKNQQNPWENMFFSDFCGLSKKVGTSNPETPVLEVFSIVFSE